MEIAKALESRSTWSSPELSEAVDCANEARDADVRNRNILRFRVLEMVASFAQLHDVKELIKVLKGQWARDALGSRPVRAIRYSLLGLPPGDPRFTLARTLSRELITEELDGRTTVYIDKALAHREELLTLPRTDLARQTLREHLEVLTSSERAVARLEEFNRGEDLLERRTRRVRNSLTHGNPLTIESINSVDNYLMYLDEFALQEAITTPVEKPLMELFEEHQTQRAKDRARLRAGEDPIEVLGLTR